MSANDTDLARPEDAPPSLYDEHGNPRFFAEPAMDRFVAVVMNLAQEIWVQEERLLELESKEREDGLDSDAAARAFVDRVFAPLREGGGGTIR